MKFCLKVASAIVMSCVVYAHYVKAEDVNDPVVCLAKNMYYEARNQGTAGLLAVSAVVLNRVNDPRFPNTVCGVIRQGPIRASWKKDGTYYPIKHRCQFSWYCDGKNDIPKDIIRYELYLDMSEGILDNRLPFLDITDGATFYHADYVKPGWAKTKTRTVEIEDHIFYKWEMK
jgi:spore germination cell wall hydrolase CwlJ-like protein|tara:strand:+ start:710 stop:1228 length:519 start_codon:yes stop_codon:yes gene_type:complete